MPKINWRYRNYVFVILFSLIILCACGLNKSPEMYALYNCSIIDGTGAAPVKESVILISRDKIEKIGSVTDITIPNGYKKIDLKGYTVLPGFINAHVHDAYNTENLSNWLKGGVTTVRDISPWRREGDSKVLIPEYTKLRDEYNKNPQYPRIVSGSNIFTKPDGYGSIFVDSPEEAKKKVNELIDNDVEIIKIALEDQEQGRRWPMLSKEEAEAIVNTAHSRGIKVSAHISHSRHLPLAVGLGINDIAHMVIDSLSDDMVKKIIDKDIYWVPTLELWHGVDKIHGGWHEKIAVNNLSKFYQSGGKIAFGTDSNGYICEFDKGFPITEVRLMKKAGMSNMDIIVAATKNAAYVCDLQEVLGTIEEGKVADILIVKGDPLEKIELLQEPYAIIHNGVIVYKNN